MGSEGRIDVFISHSAKNHELAEEIEGALSSQGLTCWIAPRNVPPGADYAASIVDALTRSSTLVVVLTPEANASRHVASEVELAVNRGLAIVPLRIGSTKPEGSLEFLLSRREWVDVSPKALASDLEPLFAELDISLPPPPLKRRFSVRIAAILALSVLVVAAAILALRPSGPDAILVPSDGTFVGAMETARGTSLGARDRTLIAVVVPDSSNRYYPQAPVISPGWRGTWTAQVYFGEDGGGGGGFELLLVEARDEVFLNEYFEEAQASGSWDGIDTFPADFTVLDTVQVVRR